MIADACGTIDTNTLEAVSLSADQMDSVVQGTGGYDALEQRGRRKLPGGTIVREDTVLAHGRRDHLQANAADLARNFSLCGWMIRRHLDFVALFDFASENAADRSLRQRFDPEVLEALDVQIEKLMAEDSSRDRMDTGGRFSREKMFRYFEAQRTTAGDVGGAWMNSGHLQAIESDLVRQPDDRAIRRAEQGTRAEWVEGVRIGTAGRPQTFAVHKRGRGGRGYEMARMVRASNFLHYGHFTRAATDQVRGVSPVTAALNNLRDVYDGVDFALAKMKVSQLFALAIFSETGNAGDLFTERPDPAGTGKSYDVNFGRGPVHLELGGDDRAQFLESKTPSAELVNFCQVVIRVAMKSLDLPYSFYDGGATNFHGTRGEWLHYERAAIDKRTDQVEARGWYTVRKYRQWIRERRLRLPRGMTIADLVFCWYPLGMSWWDPGKEIKADNEAISGALDNPVRVTRRRGNGDILDNVRQTCRVIRESKRIALEELGDENGWSPSWAASDPSVEDMVADQVEETQTDQQPEPDQVNQ